MKRRNFVNVGHAAGSLERCVYGPHAVTEWLRVKPAHVQNIWFDARAGRRLEALLALARRNGIPTREASDAMLSDLAGTMQHQGVVAGTLPFPYADLERVIHHPPRLLIIADQLQDPHNLGALLRTAEAGGAGAVIVPKDRSVPVTATVEAAAAGAGAHLAVCRVTNVVRTLARLKECGYWTVALVPREGIPLYGWEVVQPLAVVVGGETGMRRLVAKECDCRVSIPMLGNVESLNASVAAAILIFDLVRRWGAT